MTAPITPPKQAVAAELLAELAFEIEELGVALCRDPQFVATHMHELQAIDVIAQKQRGIVELLSAASIEDALHMMGLDDLKDRIHGFS